MSYGDDVGMSFIHFVLLLCKESVSDGNGLRITCSQKRVAFYDDLRFEFVHTYLVGDKVHEISSRSFRGCHLFSCL